MSNRFLTDEPNSEFLSRIISWEEILRVHANANFGNMHPREVVNNGVMKYAVGFVGGSTQFHILREHGLVTKPLPRSHKANLTEKGKKYGRELWNRLYGY